MRVPQINGLYIKFLQALLTGDRYVCDVATEPKACGQLNSAEIGGKEDVLALLGVQG